MVKDKQTAPFTDHVQNVEHNLSFTRIVLVPVMNLSQYVDNNEVGIDSLDNIFQLFARLLNTNIYLPQRRLRANEVNVPRKIDPRISQLVKTFSPDMIRGVELKE